MAIALNTYSDGTKYIDIAADSIIIASGRDVYLIFPGYRQRAPETPSGKVTAIICTVLGLPLLMG